MRSYRLYNTFAEILHALRIDALGAPEVPVATWHAMDVRGSDAHISKELQYVNFQYVIPMGVLDLQSDIKPNLPWAEDHFQERVGGEPLNPAPSEAWWPFAVGGNKVHKEGEQFSHTYPERFWPKEAGQLPYRDGSKHQNEGIRYAYGDLSDVVTQLVKDPYTRQAYLPVWFPEDTGATEGQRVPCTLGYHFMFRNGRLNIFYPMRSCDLIRHFQDDVYMACRLAQWVSDEVNDWRDDDAPIFMPGVLTMNISSLHIFKGDVAKLTKELHG